MPSTNAAQVREVRPDFHTADGLLYRSRYTGACDASLQLADSAAQLRDVLAAGALASAGMTTISGRRVYRYEMPAGYYRRLRASIALDWTDAFLYVDARDYRTVRMACNCASGSYLVRLD